MFYKAKKLLILTPILFLLSILIAEAQQTNDKGNTSSEVKIPSYFWGAYAHFNYNVHSANFNQLSSDYVGCCPVYESARGSKFSVGALFEKKLPNVLEEFLIGVRLGYADMSADFAELENIGNIELRETTAPFETKKIINAEATHFLKSKLSALSLNIYAADKFFAGFTGSIGLNFNFLLKNSFNQYEELTNPSYVVFSGGEYDGQRVRNVYPEAEIPNVNKFQFGLSLGLGYELPIGKNTFLTPEVRYNFFFTNVAAVNWKPNYLQLGMAIKFPIYKSTEKTYQRDTIIEKSFYLEKEYVELIETTEEDNVIFEKYKYYKKADARLDINLTAVGIDTNGVKQENPKIIIEEFYMTESFPILPNIYFPDGSAELARTRMVLLLENQANDFNEENMEMDALDVYHNLLNIFGKRLRENPNIKITIAGYSSGEGKDNKDPNIANKRAQAVKSYFTNVWKIPDSQLQVETRSIPQNLQMRNADITAENSKVELIPSNGFEKSLPLYMPVKLSYIEKKSNPPLVEFNIDIQAEASLDNYTLTLLQDEEKIREINGSTQDENLKIQWQIEDTPLPVTEKPVIATLKAKDLTGQEKTVQKELNIEQVTVKKKKERIEKDWKIDKYSLVLFEYDKSDISYVDKEILEEIKSNSNIEPNSEVRIIISGFADRTGDIQYNKNLAQRRCEEVSKILNVKNSKLNAVGSSKLILNNDLPEGRALSRTVQIEVRTPLK